MAKISSKKEFSMKIYNYFNFYGVSIISSFFLNFLKFSQIFLIVSLFFRIFRNFRELKNKRGLYIDMLTWQNDVVTWMHGTQSMHA